MMRDKPSSKKEHWLNYFLPSSIAADNHVVDAWKSWLNEQLNTTTASAHTSEWIRTVGSSIHKATDGINAARTWLGSQSQGEQHDEIERLRDRVERLERELNRHLQRTGHQADDPPG